MPNANAHENRGKLFGKKQPEQAKHLPSGASMNAMFATKKGKGQAVC